jgi:hypothetical protein
MFKKPSIFMMVLLIATAASLVGTGSAIHHQPVTSIAQPQTPQQQQPQLQSPNTAPNIIGVKPPIIQQQEQKLLQVTPKVLGKGQVLKQQTGITETLVGKISTFFFYASSDGKVCIAYTTISTRLYYPNYPLGLKPDDSIGLLVRDPDMCVLLGQANIANKEIAFRVALPPVTAKELPLYIQQNFPQEATYRAVLFYVLPS